MGLHASDAVMATAKKASAKKTAAKKSAAKGSATKTAAEKTAAAKKTSAKKTAGKKTSAKKTAGTKSSAKTGAKKAASKKSATKRPAKASASRKRGSEDNYTKPDLREKIKKEVIAGDKGGRPGQWSARKAQLVAHEYVAEGGGYKHPRNEAQESLKHWGEEKWHTASGEKAVQGEETHRYLPDAAWKELSPEERKATDEKKVRGSRKGKQFVANTPEANEARRHAEEE